jgi:hypothetical protein
LNEGESSFALTQTWQTATQAAIVVVIARKSGPDDLRQAMARLQAMGIQPIGVIYNQFKNPTWQALLMPYLQWFSTGTKLKSLFKPTRMEPKTVLLQPQNLQKKKTTEQVAVDHKKKMTASQTKGKKPRPKMIHDKVSVKSQPKEASEEVGTYRQIGNVEQIVIPDSGLSFDFSGQDKRQKEVINRPGSNAK